ncbi:FAD-linked oxidase C-terminal domain-containing protein [Halalkalibacterium halodurans]|uniref:FAD-linked oxidase C-terminal domain-containing protein n=2 Tax=Halalkalibacterium halodurans TaxID=86665 RepID=UPI002AAA2F0C|nr:FAD-linked oxidase C-terminal domain-containing protein [Halalkalibacterium halodurans]MDY7222693.1 FAD-linked oxidase C-terminal domain-containing protein [Halalkalibacterium halodurans]MDY7241914.1 FAD-linked oxidase C-terminal domain-containing protein [Halalkalibacterium halodurans]MED4123541.1 FAD-linked oxidase C-terminal domain-containing protein [Halalkalibacterium halodurans]MED4172284.1 FAD-linked oxidase C-terminal domain-containing protein [Halalkalibacterium halodurans]
MIGRKRKYEDPHIRSFHELLSGHNPVLYKKEDLLAYDCDGFTIHKHLPKAVVFPENTREVASIVRYCHDHNLPFLARGAGTGLSGGAIPINGEVIISLVRMKRLLEVDLKNRRAIVEPGYVNLKLTQSIEDKGYYYAPDPSSQYCCTIGGNVAENAGGAHCLKYGVTTNHILGMEVVLPNGDIVEIGKAGILDEPGYDLLGLMTGSEGTLGIVTKITVRILKHPEAKQTVLAYFDKVSDASHTVSDIISEGIVPAALEMMDRIAMEGVEAAAFPIGHLLDAEAVLLIEVDGISAGMDQQIERILTVCRKHHVREVKVATSEEERMKWWANRKTGFGAMGAISPDYLVQDGVIPRTKLPVVLSTIQKISETYGLRIANIFHAGDGNLHPLVLFDATVEGETERALQAGSECLRACAAVGGTITGEHGIGIEKKEEMRFVFTEEEINAQLEIRQVFNPRNLLNGGKLFPSPSRCVEIKQSLNK